MKAILPLLCSRLGLHKHPISGIATLFGMGVSLFTLNAIMIWLFIHSIGDVVVVGHWPDTSMPFISFQLSMLIQSFFCFDPFSGESFENYGDAILVNILLYARLFISFIFWGVAVKLLSSFLDEISSNHTLRKIFCVLAFLCVGLLSIPLALNATFNGEPCFRDAISSGVYKLNDLGMRLDQMRLLPH